MLDPAAFKAYDVRGTWPDQLDAAGGYAIGRAFAQHLEPRTAAVGRDMRTMAPEFADAVMSGLADEGVHVFDLGMVATEVLYFAVASRELDGGIQVTASHNPREYIGTKIVRRGSQPVGLDSGLDRIRDLALALPPNAAPAAERGTIEQIEVAADFRAKAMSLVDASAISDLSVVMDAGNGLGGSMITPLLDQLPITAHCYNFEPDGTFPNHEPNPLLPENRKFVIDKVTEHGADLGIAWDGDADRCFFIDDTGEFVPGDFITALLAQLTLERNPGSKILYDIRASRAVRDTIEAAGGTAVPSRVGHAFIKQAIRKLDAAFAGEVSGHYYFRGFYGVDTGLVPALMLLELVSRNGGKLSSLLAPLRERYFISGEINSRVADVPLKLQQIKEQYRDGEFSHIDGVSVDFEDWRFNVRPSNTEPLLRLNLEAATQEDMERRRDEVLDLIRSPSTARI